MAHSQERSHTIMSDYRPIAKSEDELLSFVTTHNGTITGRVTPQVAGWLLRLNTGNRPIKRAGVARFVALLERGLWVNTGEPIIISREGIINDGQHRLTAIHETGITAVADIRFGVERTAFSATGTGSKRTAADVLHINGTADATMCAAIAKLVWHYDDGSIAQANLPVESADIVAVIENNPIIVEVAKIAQTCKLQVLRRGWWGGVLTLIARRSSLEDAREFSASVDNGQGLETSATRKLHERFVQDAMNRAKMPTFDRIIMSIKAWNAWVVHRPVGLLRVIETDRSSKGFPAIAAPPERRSDA